MALFFIEVKHFVYLDCSLNVQYRLELLKRRNVRRSNFNELIRELRK